MAILKRYPGLWLFVATVFVLVTGVALKLSSQPAPVASAAVPSNLAYQHVGRVGSQAENAQAEGVGSYSITVSSADLWRTADSFQYAYQPLTGNGQIVARVVAIDGTTNGWAKAGVMIRESLEPNSRHAALVGSKGNGLAYLWRSETGSASGSTHGAAWTAPYWVKLVRYGNCLAGYQSKDGVSWELVDWQMLEMGRQVYAGLVASSHDPASSCTVRFDQVQVSMVTAWDALPLLGEGDGLRGEYFGNIDL